MPDPTRFSTLSHLLYQFQKNFTEYGVCVWNCTISILKKRFFFGNNWFKYHNKLIFFKFESTVNLVRFQCLLKFLDTAVTNTRKSLRSNIYYSCLEFAVCRSLELSLCPSWYYGRHPQRSSWWVRDGVKVRVGRRGECLLRLFCLFYVFQR